MQTPQLNSNIVSRKSWSEVASGRFVFLIDAIARRNAPTPTQLTALQSSYESTSDYLSKCKEFSGLLSQIHAHGSRQIGTLVRPRSNTREGFDIDLIARLERSAMGKYGGEGGPTSLLNDLYVALHRYADHHSLKILRWERCVTLEYAGGMFADIAPVIDDPSFVVPFGETHGRIPDRKLCLYDVTNPIGYTKFFDKAASIRPVYPVMKSLRIAADSMEKIDIAPLPDPQEVFDRLLSRLIQLMKIHRNVAFGEKSANDDVAPTSIFITTLAAKAYSLQAPRLHSGPLDLLMDVVEAMPQQFDRVRTAGGAEHWVLINPSTGKDNLAEGMNNHGRQAGFKWWHERLMNDIQGLLDAIEAFSGVDTIISLVEAAFGHRAALSIQEDESNRRTSQRAAGRIAILGAGAATVSVPARAHTFHGDQ